MINAFDKVASFTWFEMITFHSVPCDYRKDRIILQHYTLKSKNEQNVWNRLAMTKKMPIKYTTNANESLNEFLRCNHMIAMSAEQNQTHAFTQESSSPSSVVTIIVKMDRLKKSCFHFRDINDRWLSISSSLTVTCHVLGDVCLHGVDPDKIFNDYHLTFYSEPHTKLLYTTKEHFDWNTLSFGLHLYCFFWFYYTCMYFKKWLWLGLKVGAGLVALK